MSSAKPTLPLTTVFTPAPTCTLPYLSFSNTDNNHVWGSSGGTTTIQRLQFGCFPEDYFANNQKVVYSPGICPSGYTTADATTNSVNGASLAYCCPSNARFVTTSNFNHCQSPATSPGTLVLGASATTLGSLVVVQKAIVIEWDSADLSIFPTTTNASSSSPTPSSGPLSAAPSKTPSHTAPHTSNVPAASTRATTPNAQSMSTSASASGASSTLSTGAKAGIGVGAAIGGVIILLLIVLACLLRRKQASKARAAVNYFPQQPSYSDNQSSFARASVQQLEAKPASGTVRRDLYPSHLGSSSPYELSGYNPHAELE